MGAKTTPHVILSHIVLIFTTHFAASSSFRSPRYTCPFTIPRSTFVFFIRWQSKGEHDLSRSLHGIIFHHTTLLGYKRWWVAIKITHSALSFATVSHCLNGLSKLLRNLLPFLISCYSQYCLICLIKSQPRLNNNISSSLEWAFNPDLKLLLPD